MSDIVLSHIENGVRTISLNRPSRLNAINAELLEAFKRALSEANDDDHTKVIILRGEGRAFCAGDDLKEFDQQVGNEPETRAYIESIQDITREMVLGEKMIVGAIHGWAAGGGLEWMINSDLVILAKNTRWFFPEISLGFFVTGAVTTLLPKLVGLQKAKELILFGEKHDAQTALRLGLAWKVVPDTELFSEAEATAQRIAQLPEASVKDLKRVINRACHLNAEDAMSLETDATVRGFLDPMAGDRVAQFSKQ